MQMGAGKSGPNAPRSELELELASLLAGPQSGRKQMGNRRIQMLMTETNTRAMEKRVLRAAKYRLGAGRYQADFEHGQWWVTKLSTGAQWSVVDCQTAGVNYLDFEQVSEGEGE